MAVGTFSRTVGHVDWLKEDKKSMFGCRWESCRADYMNSNSLSCHSSVCMSGSM